MDFSSFWTVWLIEGFASFSLSVLEPIKSWVKQKFSQTHIYSGNCSGIPKKDRFIMILCKKSLKTLLCFVFAPPTKTINNRFLPLKGAGISFHHDEVCWLKALPPLYYQPLNQWQPLKKNQFCQTKRGFGNCTSMQKDN